MKLKVRSLLVVMCGFVGAMLAGGCGTDDGVERYQVSGTVTYEGKPVPAGEVVFEPDPKKGNKGPQSRAKITDGRFATLSAKGAVPGPAVVRIRCYDGVAQREAPWGLPLRLPYTLKIDLPRADSAQKFEVPARVR